MMFNSEKPEAVVWKCSVGKVFLEISQNSQENTCAIVSFFNKVAGFWHRCFAVNFAKFLRTPFLQNTYGDCFSKVNSKSITETLN